jgi:hypothetical protein
LFKISGWVFFATGRRLKIAPPWLFTTTTVIGFLLMLKKHYTKSEKTIKNRGPES